MAKWTDDLSKALDNVENLAFKTDDNVSVDHSVGSPGKDRMTVRVRHGAGAAERTAAIDKAHKVATDHGYDPATAQHGGTYGSGDNHNTSVSYSKQNAMQNSGGY